MNDMYSPSHDGSFCSAGCTAAQAAEQHEIFKEVATCPLSTTVLSEREVQRALQTSLAYDGSEASTTVRPYVMSFSLSTHAIVAVRFSQSSLFTKSTIGQSDRA